MKINILIIMALLLSVGTVDVSAQNFLNKLKKTVKKEVENRVEKEVKKQVNKSFDTVTGKDNDPAQTKKREPNRVPIRHDRKHRTPRHNNPERRAGKDISRHL